MHPLTNNDVTPFPDAMQGLLFDTDTLAEEFKEFVTSRPSLQSVQSVRSAIQRAKLQSCHATSSAAFRVFDNLAHDVMSYLSLEDLLRLGNTNHSLRAQVPSHLTRAFHALLRKYFPHPAAFREIMRETGSIISGSSVLSFITRDEQWTPRDLDIYAPRGEPARKLREHLDAVQGFQHYYSIELEGLTAAELDARYNQFGSYRTIYSISAFTEKQEAGDDNDEAQRQRLRLSLDVIESSTVSAVKPITSFHSTIVMNYMSADAIVVLYPCLTFSRVGITQDPNRDRLPWPEKYASREFSLLKSTTELGTKCGSACPRLTRASCDINCLRVSFNGLDNPSERGREAYLATWNLGEKLDSPQRRCHNTLCPYRDLQPDPL